MKNIIYIFLNDSKSMDGEAIQAANESLRLLLGAWSKDPCWSGNVEVQIWLASGKMYVHYSDLKQLILDNDIDCTNVIVSVESMGQSLSHLLKIPSPNGANYYRPQLIILGDLAYQWEDILQTDKLNQSPFSELILLHTGHRKPINPPFPYIFMSVEELNYHQACNLITQQKVKQPVAKLQEWCQVKAKCLQQLAEKGEMDAQFKLAGLYRRGLGLRRNMSEAKKWYLRAAGQNHVGALFELGELHWLGLIGKIDQIEALNWYKKAEKQGSVEAKYRLGILYKYGQGLPADNRKAIKYWEQAAACGNVDALREIAKMYKPARVAVQSIINKEFYI